MISLKKNNQGFTIVELLIVIVVIGILALLVITTYSGIQQKARNSQRQSDLQALQTQLEAFYSQNGYYPALADINDEEWRADNMKNLDKNAMIDPSNSNQGSATLGSDANAQKIYSYVVTGSDDAACDGETCAKYTITAHYEGTVNNATKLEKTNLD